MKKYTKMEQQINNVLVHQEKILSEIQFPDSKVMDTRISESIELLKSLGYDPDIQKKQSVAPFQKRQIMVVPSWEKQCQEAERHVGTGHDLDELFSEEELKANELAIRELNKEYNAIHKLDAFDISIAAAGGLLSA